MALPRDIKASLTTVKADGLGAVPLLMPRYSSTYDIGLGVRAPTRAYPTRRTSRLFDGGLGDTSADIATATAELQNLNQALVAANNAGQTDALPGLRQQIAYWNGQLRTLNAQQDASDRPSSFALSLSDVGSSLSNFLSGELGTVVKWLGAGIAAYIAVPAIIRATRKGGRNG